MCKSLLLCMYVNVYDRYCNRSGYGGYALFGVCALGLLVLGLALIHAVMFFNRIASIVGRIVGSVVSFIVSYIIILHP